MKSLIQILFIAFIMVSCNSNVESEKAPTIEEASDKTPVTSKKAEKDSKINLKQNGDYTSLFYAGDCSRIVNSTLVAEIVNAPVTESKIGSVCRFVFKQDGLNRYMTVSINDMSNYNIEKEIKNYLSNPPFLIHEISTTGDSHICRQDAHKRLVIYNTNYNHAVLISYGVHEEGTLTKEQKASLKDKAVDLANALLLNNQK